MTPSQTEVLRKLATRTISIVSLSDAEVKIVLDLVKRGLARDYSDFKGRRIPVHLRLWGITPAGKAILEQQALTDSVTKRTTQLNLTLQPKSTVKLTRTQIKLKPKKEDK